MVHRILLGLTASVLPGLVSAVLTRALMYLVALLTNSVPEFHLVNSLGIPVFYIIVLAPGCLALALTRARWAWVFLAAGVALLAFEAVVIGLQETANAHDLTVARWVALVGVLMLMLATYVGQVLAAVRLAGRRGR